MSGKNKVVVVGSSNMDLVAKTPRIPVAGETLSGTDFFMVPGGKGANQAVAAARLGADVVFVAKLGKDVFASRSIDNYRNAGIDISRIEQIEGVPSGIAMIAVEESGNNSIIVVPGANAKLGPADVTAAKDDIAAATVVVAQLEIPMETVLETAKAAQAVGAAFILDPAPAGELSDELLSMVDIIKPNETEAEAITGIKVSDRASAAKAADVLLDKGVKTVIITLGGRGFMLARGRSKEIIANHNVKVVDTTAAGDAFVGGLAFGIAAGKPLKDAAVYANYVAAVSVTRQGAQTSLPTQMEVAAIMNESS
ncbi:Ribokinase [Limihaloglobus sulfuriphilus]|uniref:Ribokinase n=1 Tax=Limihaloglobus sulfuriphilus TaxID=1851148 RepID=A0A1Q2MEM2_9BACT|nr:ribokinase [Limihaloglobus sulfuriphilus]AQQ71156.1 Ribokinase [Limihaloglobus sulfuriphilus]